MEVLLSSQALQARFAGATQYLKAARRYGLLHFGGEEGFFLPKAATFTGDGGAASGGVSHRAGGVSHRAGGVSHRAGGVSHRGGRAAGGEGEDGATCVVSSRSLGLSRAALLERALQVTPHH